MKMSLFIINNGLLLLVGNEFNQVKTILLYHHTWLEDILKRKIIIRTFDTSEIEIKGTSVCVFP
jgi:hypothetical protein